MDIVQSADRNIASRRSSRQGLYTVLALLAILGLAATIAGGMSWVVFAGFVFSLLFVGLFMTNIRIFLIVFIAGRTILEAFLEPTRIPLGGSSIQLVGFLGAMILFGGFIYIVVNRVKIFEISIALPVFLLLASSLPTMLVFSSNRVLGIKDWIGIASTFVLFILVASVFSQKRDVFILVGAFIASTIPPMLVGFYQFATGTGNLQTEGFNRIYGTFIHPNSLASYLVIMLLLCIPLLLEADKPWHRVGLGILCGAMILSLVLTYGRASWIGLLAGLMVLAVVRYRKMMIAGPIILVLMLILMPSIIERFQEALGYSQGEGTLFFRVQMTKHLFSYFLENPILGSGLGSFSTFVEEGMGYFYLPHNDYMRVMVDMGIIGLICYLAIWLNLARGAIRAYRMIDEKYIKVLALVLLAVVVNYLVSSATENLFRQAIMQTYLWTLAGIVAAAARVAFAEKQEEEPVPEQLSLASLQS